MYIKTVTEKELKDYMINMIVEDNNYDTFAVYHKGKYDLYDEKMEDIGYTLCVGSDYWKEQFEEYVNESTRKYTNGLKYYGEKRTLELIEKTLEDKEQFRHYLYLVNDHIEIDNDLMEIVF